MIPCQPKTFLSKNGKVPTLNCTNFKIESKNVFLAFQID